MNPQEKMEDYLKRLNCHFNWDLESTSSSSSINCNVEVLETKLLADISGNPPVACQTHLLLAFVYASGNGNRIVDYTKALKYIELSEEHAKSDAEKYLVVANKLWILKTKGDTGGIHDLLVKITKIEQEFTDIDKSDLCVAEAFSLSRFPPYGYKKALVKYKEAVTLNPKNGQAHFGIGQMLGRLRRIDHGQRSQPHDDELNAFNKSMKLWPGNPLPFVFYALALSYRLWQGSRVAEETIQEMDRYMELAKSKADTLCPAGSSVVLKWCAKGYRRICQSGKMPKRQYLYNLDKQKKCVDEAVELSPKDSSILHEAGILYWKVTTHRDIEKAETYLIKSVECSPFRKNFWADLDLVLLRKQNRHDYDVMAAYSALKTKYSRSDKDPRYLASLHQYIAMEYESLKEKDSARKEYVKSLSYDPNCNQILKTAENLPKLVEQFVEKSTCCFNSGTISKSVHFENLFEAIQTYEAFRPKKSHEAKKLYELVLRIDETKNEARKSLCDILMGMKLYDQCIEHASKLDQDKSDEIISHARAMKVADQPGTKKNDP